MNGKMTNLFYPSHWPSHLLITLDNINLTTFGSLVSIIALTAIGFILASLIYIYLILYNLISFFRKGGDIYAEMLPSSVSVFQMSGEKRIFKMVNIPKFN